MTTSNQKPIKITTPERIDRLLAKVTETQLDVILRAPDKKNVGVRGKALELTVLDSRNCLRIGKISAKGILFLGSLDEVQVEFVGMSTHLVFPATKILIDGDAIVVTKPTEMLSFDRRANSRFMTNDKVSAFASLSAWAPSVSDTLSPPVIPLFPQSASLLRICDVSEGGICVGTRFPSIITKITKDSIDNQAQFFFPMQSPMKAAVQIRWIRKIRESYEANNEGLMLHRRIYRIGLQFVSPSEDFKQAMRRLIHQLSIAEAI